MFQGDQFKADEQQRFEGVQLSSNQWNSEGLDGYIDSLGDLSNYGDSSDRSMVMLPSRMEFSVSRLLGRRVSENMPYDYVMMEVGAADWLRLGYHAEFTYTRFEKNFHLYSTVGYGNFSGFYWSEKIFFSLTKNTDVEVKIAGINSALLPRTPGGYGVSFGVIRDL